jgi:lipopolysaccharide biosynthesis glycosyltransferase
MQETIRIAFIFDEEYVLCTGVALTSLYQHRNPMRKYHVYLFTNHVPEEKRVLFLSFSCPEFVVEVFDVSDDKKFKHFNRMHYAQHVSTTALLKFELPQLLSGIDKVLYLDGDILIRDSLEELYDTNISGKYAAVCKDFGADTYPAPFHERLNIKHKSYFNSGVMLLNLKLLRERDMSQKLLFYKQNGVNDYMDQDAFNVVFEENVVHFSYLYNMLYSCWAKKSREALCAYYAIDLPDLESFYTQAKLIHFCTPKKPWKYYNVIGAEEWFLCLIDSPFRRIENHRTWFPKDILSNGCQYQSILDSFHQRLTEEKPLVSVIIPVYNAEAYLINCVESLLSQTYQNFEAIFVDDGSTDASPTILKKYAAMDSRIRILVQQNKYAGVARNNGLDHAAGKYVTFLDSDDMMLPTALELFFETANKANADIVISSAYYFNDDVNQRNIAGWCLAEDYLPVPGTFHRGNSARYLFQITGGAPWGKLYRLDFLNRNTIRFPALPRAEDFLFVYWALALAARITTLPAQTILYRTGNGQTSLEGAKDRFPLAPVEGSLLLYEKLQALGLYEQLRQSYLNNLLTRILYNLNGFQTSEAMQAMYSQIKDVLFPLFGDDLETPSFYYEKNKFEGLLQICRSTSCMDYVFTKYRLASCAYDTLRGQMLTGSVRQHLGDASVRLNGTGPWLLRKIKGGVRCYQDHGLRYSINHFFKKIKKHLKRKA